MTNTRTTKRALLTSTMALFLCFAMLLGTTYAWFTDSVTSANNIIKSGTLNVEMYYADGSKAVPADDSADWQNAQGVAIYTAAQLWEPGYVDAKHIKISNEGNLALKYQLAIMPTGEVTELAEVIDVYLYQTEGVLANATQITDRTAIDTAMHVGTLAEVINTGIVQGNLAGGTDYTTTIVLKMQESADNKYQNLSIGDNFTIQLLATQYTKEDDSFDDQYDADATFGTYIELDAGADLLAAMASADKDMPLTIKLNGDVEWPTEGHHGENDITPASSIVIDGNGYTITATGAGVTPLGDNEAPMTLKNVKIVDNSVSYNEGAWELSYLEMGGRVLNCVNVNFVDPITVDGDKATFNGCTFVGHYDKNSTATTQYGVWVANGDATFTNCTFTGTRGMKICDQYAPEVGTVVVDGCTFSNISEKPGVVIDNRGEGDVSSTEGMTVIIKNSTFINCKAGDQGLYIYETDNTVPALENNAVYNNATVVTVTTKEDLLALSAKALTGNNGAAEEAIIIIGADIDMAGAEFSAIIAQRGDKLAVIGNGHKISNVKVVSGVNDNTTGQASMFYAYPNSTLEVSNLTLENITVTADANGTGYAAAVVSFCEGTAILNNVDVVNATVVGVKSSGMLAGHLSGSLVATDCDLSGTVTLVENTVEANGHYAGKYVGTLAGPLTLNNCTVHASVSGQLNAANIGDFIGRKTAAGSLVVNGAYYVTTADELATAVANGKTNIWLADGVYEVENCKNNTLTISGSRNAIIFVNDGTSYEHSAGGFDGSKVTFNGVTLKTPATRDRAGFARMTGVYNDCAIIGNYSLFGDSTFVGCDFDANVGEHCVWTYGAKNISFVDCDFTYGDRCINVYIDNGKSSVNVDFEGCTFTTDNTDSKGAVEINSSVFPQGANVSFVDCTAPANGTMVGISGWDGTNGASATVTVDGAAFTPSQWTR